MTPLSFQEWRDQEMAARSPDVMVDCTKCSGGEVTCEECGHEHACEECNGTGLKRFGDLNVNQKLNVLDIFEYERQLIDDYSAVARFKGVQPEALLQEDELQPYVRVHFLRKNPPGDVTRISRGNFGLAAIMGSLRC